MTDLLNSSPRGILISNGLLLQPSGLSEAWLYLENGYVTATGQGSEPELRKGDLLIDAAGSIVFPGFCDPHCHGAAGHDFLSATGVQINQILDELGRAGVTEVLPSLVTNTPERLMTAVQRIAAALEGQSALPRVLGIHFEGPFLNPAASGSHDQSLLRLPDPGLAAEMMDHCRQCFRASGLAEPIIRFTLAPELPGGEALVEEILSRGGLVSLGHSHASPEQAHRAFEAGANSVTHIWNAMSRYGFPVSRRAGLAETAITQAGVFCEMIGDGVHVPVELMKMTMLACGPWATVICSDAGAGLFLEPGSQVELGGRKALVRAVSGSCHEEAASSGTGSSTSALYLDDGTLAASSSSQLMMASSMLLKHDFPVFETLASMCFNSRAMLGIGMEGQLYEPVLLSPAASGVGCFRPCA